MKYQTRTGRPVYLSTDRIGRGGEGEILQVGGGSQLVAKIFHTPTPERRSKLEFMVANPLPQADGHLWVTWPVEILFTTEARPRFAGYLMPKLTGSHPIFACYNPAVRAAKCSGFDYRHLIRCGRNLAAAFSLAHSELCVIGDSNESNVFVTSDARITLIDVDSWQITDAGGRTYRSPVAKADFLPPELQGRNLESIDRQPWHDNFSLAVLLFKLTGEGNHPFDGVYHGLGDVPALETRIKAGAFPYCDSSGFWTPKGLALPLEVLHPSLQQLFMQAFGVGHAQPRLRPDASTWHRALSETEGELRVCPNNSRHWHWGNDCPWCLRTALLGGLDPFPGGKAWRQSRTKANTMSCGRSSAPVGPSATPNPSKAGSLFSIGLGEFLTEIGQKYSRAFARWNQDWISALATVLFTTVAFVVGATLLAIIHAWRLAVTITKSLTSESPTKTYP